MDSLTQEMPEVNMLEIFNAIKKQHKDVKEIQNLKVPNVLGGKVEFPVIVRSRNDRRCHTEECC